MRLFGTDGIRGKAHHPPLDPATLARLGRALADELPEGGRVLLGHDGRESAPGIERALAAGLAAGGVGCANAGLLTTPALAHSTRLGHWACGVMISASHNPASDNGIKLFGVDGRKLGDAVEVRLERAVDGIEAPAVGPDVAVEELEDGTAGYRAFVAEAFAGLDLAGLRVLVDAANGGGSRLVPAVLRGFGAEVVTRFDAPDGRNINVGCGALHPETIAADVVGGGCDLGLCLDGDGDRAIFVDERGRVVHGDALLAILALELDGRGRLPHRRMAATVMSNLGLSRLLAAAGIGVVETPVGDRSVVAAMEASGLELGGENSGHVIFGPRHAFTGDGLWTCLELLRLLVPGRRLAAEADRFRAYPQLLLNVRCVPEKPDLSAIPAVQDAQREIEERLGAEGRVVLRYSGTEDLCRVMLEGPEEGLVRELCERLATAVRGAVGA